MSELFLFTAGKLRRYVRAGRLWRPQPEDAPLPKRCRFVIDAFDEACVLETLPPAPPWLLAQLAQRRLFVAFADTPWRTLRMLSLLRPPHRAAFFSLADHAGLDETAHGLIEKGVRIAGATLSSAQLWRLARQYRFDTGLVLLALEDGVRLLAMSAGAPALARRLAMLDAEALGEEIRRTWTFLVRQQLVSGAPRLLGIGFPPKTRQALAAALPEAQLSWQEADWQAVLFAPPAIDLAPAEIVRTERAERLGRAALAFASGALALAAMILLPEIERIVALRDEIRRLEIETRRAAADTETYAEKIRAAAASPVAARAARDLAAHLRPASEPMMADFKQLADILERLESVRLTSLDWRGNAPCQNEGAGAMAAVSATPAALSFGVVSPTSGALPRSIEFAVRLPDVGVKRRAETLSRLAAALSALPEAKLVRDPSRQETRRALKSGEKSEAAIFCIELAPQNKAGKP